MTKRFIEALRVSIKEEYPETLEEILDDALNRREPWYVNNQNRMELYNALIELINDIIT